MTAEVSKDFKNEKRSIETVLPIKLVNWRAAAKWTEETKKKNILIEESPTHVTYYVQSTKKSDEFTLDFVHQLEQTVWNSFDEYIEHRMVAYYKVQISKIDWQSGSRCQCKDFFKANVCRHLLGMAMRAKQVKLPTQAIMTPLSKKPKRGRIQKSLPALTKPQSSQAQASQTQASTPAQPN